MKRNTKEIKERQDRQDRKIGFNIIDVLIILFVILAVVGIFLRYNLADQIYLNARGEEFEVEFSITNIQEASQIYLQKGESFYLRRDDSKLGEIKEILDVREAIDYLESIPGGLVRSELPGRIDVTGVMTCYGRTTREGYMINGNTFTAHNKLFEVHTGKLLVDIVITDIKKVN